jgi:hypothetical protein
LSLRRSFPTLDCSQALGIKRYTLGAMDHRNAALAATCHCGAIRIYVRQMSRTLTSCNCSICRRYGALWAYYAASSVTIEAPKGGLSKYSWNRKIRAYYRCKKCGCVTHYAYRKKRRDTTVAAAEREEVIRNMDEVEPLLRRGASYEIDTSAPLKEVVEQILERVCLSNKD